MERRSGDERVEEWTSLESGSAVGVVGSRMAVGERWEEGGNPEKGLQYGIYAVYLPAP